MDKELRDQLASTTLATRRMLEDEFARQLEGVFDIFPDGRINDRPSDTLTPAQRFTRAKIVASIERRRAKGEPPAESVYAYMRESAFTFLNRLAAFKMMEARGLVQECVSRGAESAGFKEFCGLAPGLTTLPDKGYQLYLESLCDEIGREVGALFTRTDSSSLLWPSRRALEGVLATINEASLASVWANDETIGWIYQYYNDPAERKKMREESAAPRNSRELAVRNQFFTPRYVVEFLTDNTLGRLWYEMRRGQTALKEQCRYLVLRPAEVFLKPGEIAPEVEKRNSFSQEELLRQTVHIPHRPLKDPREIRLLDPACGSMHFGLYAFDLFSVIYSEAWEIAHGPDDIAKSAETFAPFVAFAASFTDKGAFLREVPRLIIECNIHGIDIDPRAAQIAGLSLWLRAQRAWHQAGVKPADRPRITRSNIVCAEPMPGHAGQLREFCDSVKQPAIGQMVEVIFEKMKLAGEAGSLLRIEEEIRELVHSTKLRWAETYRFDQDARELFSKAEIVSFSRQKKLSQSELDIDFAGITDESFWEKAEQRIYDALEAYAEQAENGGGFQRRLFADDAARGFAFIDLCRKRYDAVVMNPPFGSFSKLWMAQSKVAYPNSANDILGAFVERFLNRLYDKGRLGAITSRTCFFLTTFTDWRRNVILKQSAVQVIADLGQGVMDDAMVEAAAYVLESTLPTSNMTVFRAIADGDRQRAVESCLDAHNTGNLESRLFLAFQQTFDLLPDSPFVYWIDDEAIRQFKTGSSFEPDCGNVRQGLATGDDPRYVRTTWEVRFEDTIFCYYPSNGDPFCSFDDPIVQAYFKRRETGTPQWAFHVKSGASQPWYSPITLKINWAQDGEELRNFKNDKGKLRSRPQNILFYYRPGFSWTRRAVRFYPYVIPSNCIPSVSRYMAFPDHGMQAEALGVCASRLVSAFLRFYGEKFEFPNFLVDTLKALPWPELPDEAKEHFEQLIAREVEQRRLAYQNHEPFHEFLLPGKIRDFSNAGQSLAFDPESLLDADTEKMVADAFGFTEEQARAVERDLLEAISFQRDGGASSEDEEESSGDSAEEGEEADSDFVLDYSPAALEEAHLSYIVGTAFGRWDIRYATGERQPPKLPDPFDPLPVCPPGMLQNAEGLPAEPKDVPADYPLRISWPGILVDDENYPEDIVARIREAIEVIWKERAEAIEQEACAILGVKTLREYFGKPAKFFADHLKRYSKSHRQAPIYWPLSSPKGLYTIWLYYHRLTADTLFTVLRDFVKPRLELEERHGFNLKQAAGPSPTPSQARDIAASEELTEDLRAFHDELQRCAPLWRPDPNDGVIINHAPLWRIAPHAGWRKSLKETWDTLCAGEYDWSHLSLHLWPEKVIPKCAADRSLAIAHGLDAFFWEQEPTTGKWISRKRTQAEVEQLIAGRISPAVKAALGSLLAAPAPGGGTAKKGRKAKTA